MFGMLPICILLNFLQVVEFEKSGGGSELLQRQITEAHDRIQELEAAGQRKDQVYINLCDIK